MKSARMATARTQWALPLSPKEPSLPQRRAHDSQILHQDFLRIFEFRNSNLQNSIHSRPASVHSLIDNLLADGPVITDGAWGTQLQVRGLGLGEFPDAWNLTYPDRVAEVALAYVQSGSRIILTNTFGANRIRLGEHDAAEQVYEINQRGAEISRSAAKG